MTAAFDAGAAGNVVLLEPRRRSRAFHASAGVASVPSFQTDIEGLRALAVLAVVAFHATVPFITGGYVGVDVFFVISGYLITGQLLREVQRTGRVSLGHFYARRARRILPAASITLVAVAIAVAVLEPPLQVYNTAKDLLAAGLYTANWHFIALGTDYLAQSTASSPVLHFWSLAVEEQFYLVWPLLMIAGVVVARRFRARPTSVITWILATATAASFGLGVSLTVSDPKLAYMATQTRAWEFGVGALVALAASALRGRSSRGVTVIGWIVGWGGFVAIAVSSVVMTDATAFPGDAALVPALGAAGIIVGGLVVGSDRASVGALLSLPPVRLIGRLSYAWYLWHWPVMVLVESRTGTLPWQQRGLLMLASLGLAFATVRLVETPIGRWKAFGKRVAPGIALGILCMVLTATASLGVGTQAVHALGDANTKVDPGLIASAFGKDLGRNSGTVSPSAIEAVSDVPQPKNCLLDHEKKAEACAIGPVGGAPVVVFGDSHAEQWLPALERIATARGWRLHVFAKSGCPAPDYAPRPGGARFSEAECPRWRTQSLAAIRSLSPSLVIVSSLDSYVPDEGEALTSWNTTLDKLRTVGAPIAYIRDTPTPSQDVPTCISAHLKDWSSCAFTPQNHPEPVIQEARIGHESHISIIDLYSYFCSTTKCPAVRNGLLLYRDDSHITASAANALEPALDQAFVTAGLVKSVKKK